MGKLGKYIIGIAFYVSAWGLIELAGLKINMFENTKEFFFVCAAFTFVILGYDFLNGAKNNKWPWENV